MRARNIKPGFYRSADLAECSFAARLLAPALWMLADREGRLFDRPKQIKGECFPYDSIDVEPLLQELHDAGHVTRYIVSGAKCIQVEKFLEHQFPHHREKQSVIPPKSLGPVKGKTRAKPDLGTAQPPLNPESLILNPESAASKLPIHMPFDEVPTEWAKYCAQELGWPTDAVVDVFAVFKDYWQIGKGKNTKRPTWDATWRTWCRSQRIHGAKPQPAKKTGGMVV